MLSKAAAMHSTIEVSITPKTSKILILVKKT